VNRGLATRWLQGISFLLVAACWRPPTVEEVGCGSGPRAASAEDAPHLQLAPDTSPSGRPPTYVLRADSGHVRVRSGVVHLCGVRLLVFDSLGSVSAIVTAATGDYDPANEEIIASGNVVVELPGRERRLETQRLHYLPRTDRAWSPTTAWLYRNDSAVQVDSFSSNRRFTEFTLYRARGRIRL
jgi:hypothetical protein